MKLNNVWFALVPSRLARSNTSDGYQNVIVKYIYLKIVSDEKISCVRR